MKPLFKHDCKCCTFLGTTEVPENVTQTIPIEIDMYFCEQNSLAPTVIARLSSEPSDYISGIQVPKYSSQDLIETGKFSNSKEALESIVSETSSLVSYTLCLAALKALEKGLINEKFESNNPNAKNKPKKLKP